MLQRGEAKGMSNEAASQPHKQAQDDISNKLQASPSVSPLYGRNLCFHVHMLKLPALDGFRDWILDIHDTGLFEPLKENK